MKQQIFLLTLTLFSAQSIKTNGTAESTLGWSTFVKTALDNPSSVNPNIVLWFPSSKTENQLKGQLEKITQENAMLREEIKEREKRVAKYVAKMTDELKIKKDQNKKLKSLSLDIAKELVTSYRALNVSEAEKEKIATETLEKLCGIVCANKELFTTPKKNCGTSSPKVDTKFSNRCKAVTTDWNKVSVVESVITDNAKTALMQMGSNQGCKRSNSLLGES